MRKVRPDEILPIAEYAEVRAAMRAAVMAAKAERRVHLGEHLTFLFENPATVRYQVQEMLRVEGRASPEDVRHELDTYNELLGGAGELGCTLLIEIDDPLQRDLVLRKWVDLPRHLYAVRADGERAYAGFDERQIGRGRLSAVQYLKFAVGDAAPRALGVAHPALEYERAIPAATRAPLAPDHAGEPSAP
jgi:hypothetical protein